MPTTPTPSELLGARLGAYEVQGLLGSGGMARVYRGFDHNLQRPVAIKVLSEAAAQQPGLAERFRQEARLVARLRHPHIVQVYDFGQQGEITYMVQELLPGPTLTDRLAELAARGQPMPRREIIQVIRQLADALDAAHAAGIIHRDVKPSNALWGPGGALVLTDFGIAKSTLGSTSHTQTGMVLGTPVYVSPEQARGEPLTPASDIYALGVILYELIGGRPPFDGATPLEIVLKHLQEAPPPLRPLRASVPPAVEGVVQRALAKAPDERFSSAGELARALEAAWPEPQPAAAGGIHAQPTVPWRPPSVASPGTAAAPAEPPAIPGPPRRRLLLPALAALLALALLSGALLARREPSGSPTASSTPAASAGPLADLRARLPDDDPALAAQAEAAERALAGGDAAGAAAALTQLQREVLRARRDGSIDAGAMRAALAAIQRAAEQNGLSLPLTID